jgi:hypothetical protein
MRPIMGSIFKSKGVHVAVVHGSEVFDLAPRKLYDLKGVNLYRPSGELVGHLNNVSASDNALLAPPTGYSLAIHTCRAKLKTLEAAHKIKT